MEATFFLNIDKAKTDQNLRTVCQFSWTCMVKEMVHIHDWYRWEESLLIAKRALTVPVLHDKIAETNALYYHAFVSRILS